jgi:hypothetical protein
MAILVDSSVFWTLAVSLVSTLSPNVCMATKEKRFRAMFGVKNDICGKLWTLCLPLLPEGVSPVHLLWALYFLKHYNTECVNAAFAKCDEKTFRKWCWIVIEALAGLELVSLESSALFIAVCHFIWECLSMSSTAILAVSMTNLTLYALCATDGMGESVQG